MVRAEGRMVSAPPPCRVGRDRQRQLGVVEGHRMDRPVLGRTVHGDDVADVHPWRPGRADAGPRARSPRPAAALGRSPPRSAGTGTAGRRASRWCIAVVAVRGRPTITQRPLDRPTGFVAVLGVPGLDAEPLYEPLHEQVLDGVHGVAVVADVLLDGDEEVVEARPATRRGRGRTSPSAPGPVRPAHQPWPPPPRAYGRSDGRCEWTRSPPGSRRRRPTARGCRCGCGTTPAASASPGSASRRSGATWTTSFRIAFCLAHPGGRLHLVTDDHPPLPVADDARPASGPRRRATAVRVHRAVPALAAHLRRLGRLARRRRAPPGWRRSGRPRRCPGHRPGPPPPGRPRRGAALVPGQPRARGPCRRRRAPLRAALLGDR